jgi:hypothetical protein
MVNADFYGAKIGFSSEIFFRKIGYIGVPGWTTEASVATLLRHLRVLAEESKNHDLERDLYVEERKAERGIYFATYLRDGWLDLQERWRGVTTGAPSVRKSIAFSFLVYLPILRTATNLLVHSGWIGAMFVYWLLADYGRSFLRPVLALLLSMVVFHAAYWFALEPQAAPGFYPRVTAALHRAIARPQENDPPFVRATRAFAIANAVPFVGALTLDKEIRERVLCRDQPTPPCVPIPWVRFQALALLQTIFSALCVFFIALALRNYFRMR